MTEHSSGADTGPAPADQTTPHRSADADALAARIVEQTGGDIRLALPLGLGKANTLANALTRMARRDRTIRLDIFTALTLERPDPKKGPAARFLGPARERLFGAYRDLDYARHLRAGTLPDNITVSEFFFQAGNWLHHGAAQQNYITANYTDARDVLYTRRPNVVAQLLARSDDRFSLSCNTDISADLIAARAAGKQDFILAGEVNDELPFMPGTGEVDAAEIDLLLDAPGKQFGLFSVPKRPVDPLDHAIGLHAARLVRDGGTLQIGIGSLGDAVAHALILRHHSPAAYRALQAAMPFARNSPFDESGPFDKGLYAVTEMLVQGILELLKAGVIRRRAQGALVHAGFFLDCRDFYRALREMDETDRARIQMMPVSFTNRLYGGETDKRRARRHARFFNSAMKATLLGGVVSDITEGGQIVSGVGGQYDFVSQAFALEDARAVLMLPATRTSHGRVTSNIVWEHPHETIPRHLRDVIITEYGIADLRGKSDADAIRAMIAIADSRFQPDLLAHAKRAGKLPRDEDIPIMHRANTPQRLRHWLERPMAKGLLPRFPFGCDFTTEEQRLLPALDLLKASQGAPLMQAQLIWLGLRQGRLPPDELAAIERMQLRRPGLRDAPTALALRGALAASRSPTLG